MLRRMKHVLVIDIPGLSRQLIEALPDDAYLKNMARRCGMVPVVPGIPSVTCPVQASVLTGTTPAWHGVVANGLYDKRRLQVSFWEQSAYLIDARFMWERLKEQFPGFQVATLFWQFSIASPADIVLTPAPIHKSDGGMIMSCYSNPPELGHQLAGNLGEFDLRSYWGPGAGFASSEWITEATLHTMKAYQPNLLFTYLPQLDYTLQRHGPDATQTVEDLIALQKLVKQLVDQIRNMGGKAIIFSEYSMLPVVRDIRINRALLEAGLIKLRWIAGKAYLDYAGSKAVALPDHQIAHVYLKDAKALDTTLQCMADLKGVDTVYTQNNLYEISLDSQYAGDLVCIAESDKWFSYPWWPEEEMAPDFAFTVDIHRKPGYDPLELFLDPVHKRISQDPLNIKGSHGRHECEGVFIDCDGFDGTPATASLRPHQVSHYLSTRPFALPSRF